MPLGFEKVEKFKKAQDFPVNAKHGRPVEETMHAAGSEEGTQKTVMDFGI